jgi:hypothetical protein
MRPPKASENARDGAADNFHSPHANRYCSKKLKHTQGSVRVRYNPTDVNLADVLTKAVPAATFQRLVKICLDSKRGEYYVNVADEKVNYVSDEKTWMVTVMWCEKQNGSMSQLT